ncbi:MAG TPA: secretion system protein F [Chromatiaceae bacterium]|nr:secretion system protein F [Chromatiaceae bacterium]
MDFYIVLAILFVGLTAVIWTVMTMSMQGFDRYQTVFTERTESKLQDLFLFFDTRKIFIINILGLLVLPVVIYFLTDSVFYVVLAVLVLLFLPKFLLRRMEAKRRQKINETLPDALAQFAGGMRAGSTFSTAIETMVQETKGPISQEFSLLLREQRLGTTMGDALDNLGERVQTEEMDLVITAAQIANDVGGNLSEIFERLSDTLHRKMEMEGKIKSLTSQGVLQGWVVGLLPFGIIAALYVVDKENIAPIFTNLLGWGFLAIILLNELLGGLLIRKIVSIDI